MPWILSAALSVRRTWFAGTSQERKRAEIIRRELEKYLGSASPKPVDRATGSKILELAKNAHTPSRPMAAEALCAAAIPKSSR